MYVCEVEYVIERDGQALRSQARAWGADASAALQNAVCGVTARVRSDRWFGGAGNLESLVLLLEVSICRD